MNNYHKLLQKAAVLKTKIHQLEINTEVNGLCRNDSTLPCTHNSGQERANTQLIIINKTSKTQEGCMPDNKSTSRNPPWNPKSKSFLGK